jgi:hypothetical protein
LRILCRCHLGWVIPQVVPLWIQLQLRVHEKVCRISLGQASVRRLYELASTEIRGRLSKLQNGTRRFVSSPTSRQRHTLILLGGRGKVGVNRITKGSLTYFFTFTHHILLRRLHSRMSPEEATRLGIPIFAISALTSLLTSVK